MKHFSLLLVLLLLCSCTETVTTAVLDAKAAEQDGNSFPNKAYYIGSDGGYDYFIIRRFYGGSSRYRVLESESAVTNRFSLTKDEARWRGYSINAMNVILVTNGQVVVPTIEIPYRRSSEVR